MTTIKDLNVRKVAVELGLSPDSVKTLIHQNELAAYDAAPRNAPNRAWRITRQSRDDFKPKRTKQVAPRRRRKAPTTEKVIEFF